MPTTLRNLPDFFVALPELSKTWLVEVKYRSKWTDSVRDRLGEKILEQVKQWQPVYLVIFIGEPARNADTPANYLRVCRVICRDDTLGILKAVNKASFGEEPEWVEEFTSWDSVTWDSMSRFQDVFDGVSERYEESTLIKAINVMKSLG